MRVLDLFAGIGGFSLGLERAGMRTVGFCEIDPYCRRVLAKHWPDVPCHDDIRTFRPSAGSADVICGGFPCQDISYAGDGAGLAGERSGLWSEFARLIGEIRPKFVIVENVSALLSRGLGTVLGDLAALGYDAEWHCIPASSVGAPHRRDRLWLVGYPNDEGKPVGPFHDETPWLPQSIAYANGHGLQERVDVAAGSCPEARSGEQSRRAPLGVPAPEDASDTERRKRSLGWPTGRVGRFYKSVPRDGDWPVTAEPVLDRGADGIPARLDRLRALGNAIVPQIAEIIGKAIMAAEAS